MSVSSSTMIPGRDLGLLRQPGHRFFFDPSEVEPLPPEEQGRAARYAEAAHSGRRHRQHLPGRRRLWRRSGATAFASATFPAAVRVADFGIRGFDLAFALQDGYETTILIDAFPHGQPPGTVYVVEPDLNDPAAALSQENFVEPHAHESGERAAHGDGDESSAEARFAGGLRAGDLWWRRRTDGLESRSGGGRGEAMKVVASLVEKASERRQVGQLQRTKASQAKGEIQWLWI